MTDTHGLTRFNLFQQIIEWLTYNQQDLQKGRHYLEKHLPLATSAIDKELERLIYTHAAEHRELTKNLDHHLQLLHEAHRRGGTRQAVRDTYINHFGGLTLDIPSWLNVLLEQRRYLLLLNRHERTRKRQAEILRDALKHAIQADKIRSEVCAELRNMLGEILITGPQYSTQALQTKALEDSIEFHKLALKAFTHTRYPLQYAKTQMLLGNAYLQYGQHGTLKMYDLAIRAFQAAMRVYTLEAHPEQWLKIQTFMGLAILKRSKGKPTHNIEQAITYQQTALSHVSKETPATLTALIHAHLGDCYYERLEGVHGENLQRAKASYQEALHTFTPEHSPEEWAATHIRLAAVFQALPYQDQEQHDRNLHCAIVCYEEALRTYQPDVYLVENAATLVSLGYIHKQRFYGDRQHHLLQASRCFRRALHIFTSNTFPANYRQTLLSLAESERLRKEEIQQQQQASTPIKTESRLLPSPPGLRS